MSTENLVRVVGVTGNRINPLPKKKKFFDRFKKNTEEAAKKEASKSKKNK